MWFQMNLSISVRSVNKQTPLNTGWPLTGKNWKSQGIAK